MNANRQVGDVVMKQMYRELRERNPYLPPPEAVTRHSGLNLRVATNEMVTLTIEVTVAVPDRWLVPESKEITDE